jgi:hypothetical protein
LDTPKSRALAENLAVTRMAEINYDPNALIFFPTLRKSRESDSAARAF